MKILAIRGQNLASLAGSFEIDFRKEPLASAGLFAITGPTGAGKSTLLDALGLALYGLTPRLSQVVDVAGATLPDTAGKSISVRDSRNLLRRGAGEGAAEADFVGNDGVEYRARWSVRRARSKATGALQPSESSLIRIDGQVAIGRTGTEVLGAIRDRIGLTYQQFTRSVLLAQNEFSTFLKSGDADRAQLLETLTGTAIFQQLSVLAFERHKREQESLSGLEQRQAGQRPMPTHERAQLEVERAEVRGQVGVVEAHIQKLQSALRWHDQWSALLREDETAHEAVRQAQAAVTQARPRQETVDRLVAIQGARPLRDAHQRSRRELQSRSDQHQLRCVEDAASARDHEKALEGQRVAARAVDEATRALEAALPDLDRARALDARREALGPGVSRLEREDEVVQERLRSARAAEDLTAMSLQGAVTALAEAHLWQQTNGSSRVLGEQWMRWDSLLTSAARVAAQRATLQERLEGEVVAQAAARDELEARSGAVIALEARRRDSESVVQVRLDELAAFDELALEHERRRLEARRDALVAAQRALNRHVELTAEADELTGRVEQLGLQVAEANVVAAAQAQGLVGARAALEQARAAFDAAGLACARSVEDLRARLVPGKACPVCGAEAHPYGGTGARVLHGLLETLGIQLREREAALQSLQEEQGETQAAIAAANAALTRDGARLEALARPIETSHADLAAMSKASGLEDIEPPRRATWLFESIEEVRQGLARHELRETAGREARRAADQARSARDDAIRRLDEGRAGLDQARQGSSTTQACLDQTRTALDALATLVAEKTADLDAAFEGTAWTAQWAADPEAFHASARDLATAWIENAKALVDLERSRVDLERELQVHRTTRELASTQWAEASLRLRAASEEVAAVDALRLRIFAGAPVSSVEAELRRAIELAESRHRSHERSLQVSADQRSSARTRLEESLVQVEAARADAAVTEAALTAWLTESPWSPPEAPLDLATLEDMLARPAAWIEEEQGRLRALDNAHQSALTLLGERTRKRRDHEGLRPSELPRDELEQSLLQAQSDLNQVNGRAGQIAARLLADDESVKVSAQLSEAIQQQQTSARVWADLAELIGSADGKKFRMYAQQFTLDVLLGFANRHLASLARRYRLERVGASLGLLVVDQEMADERRSVHSLSGGETFLVSLGLALGLASLSSGRIRVESLFVDEGFGSLDAESLSAAMEALDRLQAQGRKVGVISHVQDLTDRIGTQIQVRRSAGGASRVVVVG